MTTSLVKYHSCGFCSPYILSISNDCYRSKFKPQSKVANEMFLFSNVTLREIRKGSSANCRFYEWLVSQWRFCNEQKYDALLAQEDVLLLYATTYCVDLLTHLPIDEINHFGLWDGKTLGSSSSPECLIRTCASIDVLTPEGQFAQLVS